jgi:hypothetical protein
VDQVDRAARPASEVDGGTDGGEPSGFASPRHGRRCARPPSSSGRLSLQRNPSQDTTAVIRRPWCELPLGESPNTAVELDRKPCSKSTAGARRLCLTTDERGGRSRWLFEPMRCGQVYRVPKDRQALGTELLHAR